MPTPTQSPDTVFTRDILGRYVCNGLDEALRSADRAVRPDARPFTVVVLGGGTFGAAFAQHLFFRDRQHRHRTLVLEAGPVALPEHVQNLPVLDLNPPSATSIQDLRAAGQFGLDKARSEVWGLPWHAPVKFPGLAYCVGGRSLFWGGWSPQPLPAELPTAHWPAAVIAGLTQPLPDGDPGFFRQASEQIGVTETNDFIFGALHDALAQRLLAGIQGGSITSAVPLAELPLHLDGIPPGKRERAKLEAPLAVQGRPPRSGFFPLNKFSSMPLLIRAARAAVAESGGDDVKKRLMIVSRCHAVRLVMNGTRVAAIETNQGTVGLGDGGAVVLALGTIESTRLALASFTGLPGAERIGQNLLAHLRSNLTVRIPRAALPGGLPAELAASALFLKGRHTHADGSVAHFHLQITAAGLGPLVGNAETELFQKIPDIDTFTKFAAATEDYVVIHLRAIGEMEAQNPLSRITLDPELDEFLVPRALVRLEASAKDQALWEAMDTAGDQAATVFANSQQFEVDVPGQGWMKVNTTAQLATAHPHVKRRDGLGTTHHEAGTLWMGPAGAAVTNSDGCFHAVPNAYAVGPAVCPTVGSPNPMLTGIALTRRLVRQFAPNVAPYQPADGQPLFDGASLDNWRMAGLGRFQVVDGTLEAVPDADLGLLWCLNPTPPNFELRLEWLRWQQEGNSGVFVRFPDPRTQGYNNAAYVPVNMGFEVQIDELGQPDGLPKHRTGAIYNEDAQTWIQQAARPAGEWNDFLIRVVDQRYEVHLNGQQITRFLNGQAARGAPSTPAKPSYIGLQGHPGSRVAFRNIRIAAL